jgi:hypothetical protein
MTRIPNGSSEMMGFRSSFLFLGTQERDMIEIARFPPTPFFLSAGQKKTKIHRTKKTEKQIRNKKERNGKCSDDESKFIIQMGRI